MLNRYFYIVCQLFCFLFGTHCASCAEDQIINLKKFTNTYEFRVHKIIYSKAFESLDAENAKVDNGNEKTNVNGLSVVFLNSIRNRIDPLYNKKLTTEPGDKINVNTDILQNERLHSVGYAIYEKIPTLSNTTPQKFRGVYRVTNKSANDFVQIISEFNSKDDIINKIGIDPGVGVESWGTWIVCSWTLFVVSENDELLYPVRIRIKFWNNDESVKKDDHFKLFHAIIEKGNLLAEDKTEK